MKTSMGTNHAKGGWISNYIGDEYSSSDEGMSTCLASWQLYSLANLEQAISAIKTF